MTELYITEKNSTAKALRAQLGTDSVVLAALDFCCE
jgi:hypothetical protein